MDFCFSGITDSTIQTKDCHCPLCSESPTNISLFPCSFLRAISGLNLSCESYESAITENFEEIIFQEVTLPWQNAFIRLPFPVPVIRIIPSVLYTGNLPVDIRARPVRIQGLDGTIKHPIPTNNITFLWIKIKSVICWKIKRFALQLCFITCQKKKKRLVYSYIFIEF